MKKFELPHNMGAEQALIGILLYDNEASHTLPAALRFTHFYQPVHGRVFHEIQKAVSEGRTVDSLIVSGRFDDASMSALGGTDYLVHLMHNAPPSPMASEYAREIMGLALRRDLMRSAEEIHLLAADLEEDPSTSLYEAEKLISGLRVFEGAERLIDASEAVDMVFRSLDCSDEDAPGVLTGLEPIDKHLGPMMPDDLIVLGGRPSMGKSALASVVGSNIALKGFGVMEFNSEMSVEQQMRRRLTSFAYSVAASQAPSYAAIRKRMVGYDQRQVLNRAAEIARSLPVKSLKKTGLTISRIRSIAQRQIAEWKRIGVKPGLMVVDHVGHMRGEKSRSRYEEQTEISGGLKELAGDLGIPVIALAQLSRTIEQREDKRPIMADLRDSGAWEQDADIVMGVYRDAYYAQRETEPKDNGTAKDMLAWQDWDKRRKSQDIEAILLKVREGEAGVARLWGHMPTNTILGQAPNTDGGLF